MCDSRFYICKKCGNLLGLINCSGAPIVCCGEEMTPLIANTVDASKEKHVPVVTAGDGFIKVDIGSVPHPMTEAHLIEWVYLQTDRGGQRKCLNPGEAPSVTFCVREEKPVAVYAYCNLHSLWMTAL